MRHLSALGLSVWEDGERPDQRVAPEVLFRALQSLADENLKVRADPRVITCKACVAGRSGHRKGHRTEESVCGSIVEC